MLKSKQHRKRPLQDLGIAIRNRRVDLGLSQHQLGVKAALHRTHVTDIEGGLRNLSFLTLLRVAEGLEYSLSELVGDAESINGFQIKR
jgi:Helix-turn-helix.